MANLVGRKLEHYQIDQLLGEGGMGAVYRARDVNLGRFVALKVMHPHLARREDFKRRFLVEGQAAARLDHPGIAKILAFGQDNDQLYMVMEYVSGGSFSNYIFRLRQEGRVVELREMLYLVAQVADALDYAHRNHIIHRDLKPDNILLKQLERPERPNEPPLKTLITDFGLAKLLDEDPFTNVNAVMGTLAYMSPEQALSRSLDGRSDLYSLGVMLYQLAVGQLPFNVKSPTDAILKHRDKMPPPPEQVKPGLPPTVAAIINKSLAKSPRGRYQRGELLAADLRQAASRLSAADVTRFQAELPVLSLVTILRPEAGSPPPHPSFLRPEVTLPEGQYLIIARKGEQPRPHRLGGSRVTIGRSRSADIVLEDEGVSRVHARLERVSDGGWRVVDLNSINGTLLEGSRLLPDVAHPWQQGQSLQIGPFFLTWEGTAAATQTLIATQKEIQTAVHSANATVLRSATGNLDIIVEPNTVTVDAGGVGEINVKLVNSGAQVGHFHLDITGLQPGWYSLPESPVRLLPEVGASLPVALHPPRHPGARSGPHTFRLSVISQQQTAVASTSPVLVINPFQQLGMDMQPSQIVDGGSVRLTIRNQGNADTGLWIGGQDAAEALEFRPSEPSMTLPPGSEATVPVQVQAKKRPLIGTTKTMPFDILVKGGSDSAALAEKRPGQVIVAPRFPAWAIPLAALLLIICCGAALFANGVIADNNATKTAEAIAAAQTAALQQTAAASVQDSDGDGLDDEDELTVHQTNPNLADSDGDGLNDSDEILVYRTNPNNPDEDGDSLSDGVEVGSGTDPKNRDTDGDGIPDNLDPQPSVNPTNTPAPPPTLAPSNPQPAIVTDTPRPTVPTNTPLPDTPVPPPTDTPTIPPPPTALLSANRTGGMAPLEVQFTGSQSSGAITSYSWNFKDGGTSDTADTVHTFFSQGVYNVELTVTGPGGQNSLQIPIVVAPTTSQALYWEIWLGAADVGKFGTNALRWQDTFPGGSLMQFRPEVEDQIIPYLKNEAPLALGEPDVLFLSWENYLALQDLFLDLGYVLYDPASGNQPPDNIIFPITNIRPLLDSYQVSTQFNTNDFAVQNNVVYGIPYQDGYLVPIQTQRMGFSNEQAFAFAMWLHLNQ